MTQAIVPKELLTATTGGLSLLVVSGGSTGNALLQQSDGTYAPEAVSGGSGDVVGPSSSTDNAFSRYDTTTGKLLQNSLMTQSDTGATVVNASSGFTGNILDLQVAGVSKFSATHNGRFTAQYWVSPLNGAIFGFEAGLGAGTLQGYGVQINVEKVGCSQLLFVAGGSVSASTPGLIPSGTTVKCRLSNDSADAPFTAAAITASGLMCAGVYTFATVPTASSNTGKFLRISDRAQKHAYSDGTNWRFFGDDAVIS